MIQVLFVCTGNVNRSIAAHVIAETLNGGRGVYMFDSASVGGPDKHDKPPARKMRRVLQELGYPDPFGDWGRRSQYLTQEIFDQADVIFYMQPSHLNDLSRWGDTVKCLSFAKVAQLGVDKVKDPQFERGIETHFEVARLIEKGVRTLF